MGRDQEEPEEKKKEVKYRIEYHPEVENDLQEAFEYYEEKREGLGDEFILSVEAIVSYIRRNPGRFQKISRNTRKANVKRFPFGIFYILQGHTIFVSAVTHQKRKPGLWRKRKKIG